MKVNKKMVAFRMTDECKRQLNQLALLLASCGDRELYHERNTGLPSKTKALEFAIEYSLGMALAKGSAIFVEHGEARTVIGKASGAKSKTRGRNKTPQHEGK